MSYENIEKLKLEKLLEMGSGYVLDLSNQKFQEFVFSTVKIDIWGDKYSYASGSKANRLRSFWDLKLWIRSSISFSIFLYLFQEYFIKMKINQGKKAEARYPFSSTSLATMPTTLKSFGIFNSFLFFSCAAFCGVARCASRADTRRPAVCIF